LRLSGDRLVAVGAAITGVGATFAAAFWTYTIAQTPHQTFWQAPGYASIAISALGLVLMAGGLLIPNPGSGSLKRREAATTQPTSRAGGTSTSIQTSDPEATPARRRRFNKRSGGT
jgi:hypothetical protein